MKWRTTKAIAIRIKLTTRSRPTTIISNIYVNSSSTTSTSDTKTETKSPLEETTTSIDEIVKGDKKYTQIPKSSSVITKKSTSGGSSVIPIAAGVAAAAAAGIGAKAYIDRKNNNDNGEDDDLDTEEWSEGDNLDIEYDDSSEVKEETLLDEDTDDYEYEPVEEEKYGARNNEEIADLQ